eukprot:COSAG01_NODE_1388_length_10504_cov_15.302835_9_plen_146_part_00
MQIASSLIERRRPTHPTAHGGPEETALLGYRSQVALPRTQDAAARGDLARRSPIGPPHPQGRRRWVVAGSFRQPDSYVSSLISPELCLVGLAQGGCGNDRSSHDGYGATACSLRGDVRLPRARLRRQVSPIGQSLAPPHVVACDF